jgi:hypothetical protein
MDSGRLIIISGSNSNLRTEPGTKPSALIAEGKLMVITENEISARMNHPATQVWADSDRM